MKWNKNLEQKLPSGEHLITQYYNLVNKANLEPNKKKHWDEDVIIEFHKIWNEESPYGVVELNVLKNEYTNFKLFSSMSKAKNSNKRYESLKTFANVLEQRLISDVNYFNGPQLIDGIYHFQSYDGFLNLYDKDWFEWSLEFNASQYYWTFEDNFVMKHINYSTQASIVNLNKLALLIKNITKFEKTIDKLFLKKQNLIKSILFNCYISDDFDLKEQEINVNHKVKTLQKQFISKQYDPEYTIDHLRMFYFDFYERKDIQKFKEKADIDTILDWSHNNVTSITYFCGTKVSISNIVINYINMINYSGSNVGTKRMSTLLFKRNLIGNGIPKEIVNELIDVIWNKTVNFFKLKPEYCILDQQVYFVIEFLAQKLEKFMEKENIVKYFNCTKLVTDNIFKKYKLSASAQKILIFMSFRVDNEYSFEELQSTLSSFSKYFQPTLDNLVNLELIKLNDKNKYHFNKDIFQTNI